jgi:hypothetical protein
MAPCQWVDIQERETASEVAARLSTDRPRQNVEARCAAYARQLCLDELEARDFPWQANTHELLVKINKQQPDLPLIILQKMHLGGEKSH